MTITINKEEAIKTISTLLQSVREGNEVLIEEEGCVNVRISPEPSKKPARTPGSSVGLIEIMPEFYEPLTEEELKDWGY